ncbi:MAG: hypothetical protein N4A44_02125 [Alphaproteobacteria bacterium]|jgi:hypothetical protein|nr:hypothetical protein [Alphaproteobacteria bacterium]
MKNKINSHFKIVVTICTACATMVFLKFALAQSETQKSIYREETKISEEIDNYEAMEEKYKLEIEKKQKIINTAQSKMKKLRTDIFETVQEIHIIKQNVRELFNSKKNTYEGLTTLSAINSKIIPEVLISPVGYQKEGTIVTENGIKKNVVRPWGQVAINRFGGLISVDSVGDNFKHKYFRITYSGLPNYICEALILSRWEDSYIGSAWVGVNGHYFSWEEEFQENSLPINQQKAKEICRGGGYFQIGFE